MKNPTTNPTKPRSQSWVEKNILGSSWSNTPKLLPGLIAAISIMLLAGWLAGILGAWVLQLQGIAPEGKPSPISGMMVAIVSGILIANSIGTPAILKPGLDFGMKKILRLGIILVGIKLSIFDVLKLGAYGIPIIFLIIACALVFTTWFAKKIQLSDRMGTLAAAATSICGVTATIAVAPTIEAEDKEVAYTIANVSIFGLIAMFIYPYLAHILFGAQSAAAGLFLGASIHDTSQVMGAATSYKEVFHDDLAFKMATITKLTRNIFLAAVVPFLAFYYAKKQGTAGKKVDVVKLFPLFVLGFLAMAVFRSLGDNGLQGETHLAYGQWDSASWTHLTKSVGETWSFYALGTAMASVGLSTDLKVFKGLGFKPLYVGAVSALFVGALAAIFASVVGRFIV